MTCGVPGEENVAGRRGVAAPPAATTAPAGAAGQSHAKARGPLGIGGTSAIVAGGLLIAGAAWFAWRRRTMG
jgi:LPXTG-motif cell wall-anchored protein